MTLKRTLQECHTYFLNSSLSHNQTNVSRAKKNLRFQSAFCHFWKDEIERIDSSKLDVWRDELDWLDAVQVELL